MWLCPRPGFAEIHARPPQSVALGSWHHRLGISIDFTMHSNKGEQRMLSHNYAISAIQGEEDIFHVDGEKLSGQKWERHKGNLCCHLDEGDKQ